MTTKSEIKKWARPFVEARTELVLNGRALLLKPVHHIARGIYFQSSSSKNVPNVAWFMDLLFAAPRSWNAFFEQRCRVGRSDVEGFSGRLAEAVNDSLDRYLLPTRTLREFLEFASADERRFLFLNLSDYAFERGTVLAALGLLEEARAILAPAIVRGEERALAELSRGKALLATPRKKGVGEVATEFATRDIEHLRELRKLLTHIEAGDRPAVVGLLHEWELARVKQRCIEHLWEPTPFPLEEAGKSGG